MCTIMIVEDEVLEQEFLKTLLEAELSSGDQLLICDNGLQAVKKAKQHQPDIIIMDVMIPEMDGLTALAEIRTFLPAANCIILSAYSDFFYAQKAISLKVHEYLLKPVKPLDFQQMLRPLLKAVSAKPEEMKVAEKRMPSNELQSAEVQDFMKRAITYIHENFKEKLTLQMVASQVYLNPQYFSRIFKKELGVTYTDYVNNLKILNACRLLETTNYPAYRISGECGFTDPSYFNHVFVRQMKMTPKEYKRKSRQNQSEFY